MPPNSMIACALLFLAFLGGVLGNVGDEALRMVSCGHLCHACARFLAHFPSDAGIRLCPRRALRARRACASEYGGRAVCHPPSLGLLPEQLTAPQECSMAPPLEYPAITPYSAGTPPRQACLIAASCVGTLADVLRGGEVRVGVLTGYHESSMDDIRSLHAEIFQKCALTQCPSGHPTASHGLTSPQDWRALRRPDKRQAGGDCGARNARSDWVRPAQRWRHRQYGSLCC